MYVVCNTCCVLQLAFQRGNNVKTVTKFVSGEVVVERAVCGAVTVLTIGYPRNWEQKVIACEVCINPAIKWISPLLQKSTAGKQNCDKRETWESTSDVFETRDTSNNKTDNQKALTDQLEAHDGVLKVSFMTVGIRVFIIVPMAATTWPWPAQTSVVKGNLRGLDQRVCMFPPIHSIKTPPPHQ